MKSASQKLKPRIVQYINCDYTQFSDDGLRATRRVETGTFICRYILSLFLSCNYFKNASHTTCDSRIYFGLLLIFSEAATRGVL